MRRSFSLRALAVRKVVSNKGKRTAGVDGKIWVRDSDKMKAVRGLLLQKSYQARPVRRV